MIDGVEATIEQEREMEQYSNDLTSAIKQAYKHLYSFGLTTEKVREKLDLLARFMGELSTSRLNLDQLKSINMWLSELETLNFKF